jgi:hypothetical protein
MSKVIRLSDVTWAELAAYVGVTPESLTDKQAREAIVRLLMRAEQPSWPPLTSSPRMSGELLLAAYRASDYNERWLASQKKRELRLMARKLGVVTTETHNGRYYRNDELRDLIANTAPHMEAP